MSLDESLGVCCARTLDHWTADFLQQHANQSVTVFHLACGLDARCFRVARGSEARWVDVDLEDVAALRTKLFLDDMVGDYSSLLAPRLISRHGWVVSPETGRRLSCARIW